jgi:uncharacterized caspase-like protein
MVTRPRKWFYLLSLGLGLGLFTLASTQAKALGPALPPQPTITLAPQLAQQQQPRVALVIGNAAYAEDSLDNPVNDATDIATALRSLGFEVTLLVDKDLRAMNDALETFNRQLQRGSVGVFYYAGHGVQVNGENYLVPLGARLNRQNDVSYETLPLGKVLNAMEDSEAQVKVVIIDACRDNPFIRRWRSNSRSSSVQRGLAINIPPEGTIVSFATGPDDVAADGEGRNSPYTASLLRHINTPDVDINEMFRAVRQDVMNATNREQIPWYQESLVGKFSFNPSSNTATTPPPSRPPSTPPSNNRPPEPTLISAATGVNYQPLKDALVARDYRLADETTANLMVRAAGREAEGWLREEDARNFSCDDLKIIDQLWLDHSNGKFGFSVQQQIYTSLGGTPGQYNETILRQLGDQVGWRQNNQWMSWLGLTFSATAPRGHLPARWRLAIFFEGGGMGWVVPSFLWNSVDCST